MGDCPYYKHSPEKLKTARSCWISSRAPEGCADCSIRLKAELSALVEGVEEIAKEIEPHKLGRYWEKKLRALCEKGGFV